jgi:hypothetical protein
MVRKRSTRIAIGIGGFFVFSGMILATNLGYTVSLSARQASNLQDAYPQLWITTLLHGMDSGFGTLFLGTVFGIAVLAPFAGASTLSLLPSEDLQAIRPNKSHRYFDSCIINSVSGVAILQLLALTGATSLLTIGGQELPALAVTWILWILLVALTTTVAWILEWIIRKFARVNRITLGIVIALLTIAIITIGYYRGGTLFGIGEKYSRLLIASGHGWNLSISLLLLGLLLTFGVLVLAGVTISRKALLLPPPLAHAGSKHRPRKSLTGTAKVTLQLLLRAIWRTAECRRPLIAILVLGIPAVVFSKTDVSMELSLVFAVTLTVSLAWGVNVFGVLGTGMGWLGSQPKIIRRLPLVGVALQTVVTVFLMSILWVLSLALGKGTLSAGVHILIMGGFAAFATSIYCMRLSIRKPIRTQLAGRGNALVPPLTALGYLLQLLMITGIPIVLSLMPMSLIEHILAFAFFLMLLVIGFLVQQKRWEDPEMRARVVQIVAAL